MKKLIFILSFLPASAFANIFDMGEHSGIIRDSNGNYSRVSPNGTIRSLTSNSALQLVEKVPISTSKGVFEASIIRNVAVDTARIGATVRKYAVAGGPVGVTIAAASLICDLTHICNQAGQWFMNAFDPLPGQPNTYPAIDGKWTAWANRYASSPEMGCRDSERITVNVGSTTQYEFDHITQIDANTYSCWARSKTTGSVFYSSNTSKTSGCADGYALSGTTCNKVGATSDHVPTVSDWDNAVTLLNDNRFVPELNEKDQDIPVSNPSLPSPVSIPIGKTTITTRDQSGNVTGTQEDITSATIDNVSPANNPTNSPSVVNISETTITNNYNTNNQLTSSTTTTSGSDTVQQPKPEGFTIDFDNSSDTPLENYSVPASFSYTSWGSGQCPADRSVSYHYGTLNLTFQPACDFAIAMQPAILAIAGFLAMFIIAGVRNND